LTAEWVLSNSDKSTVINACEETQRWLDRNQLAETGEIEHQYKDLERKCQRIMTKMHGGAGGGAGGQQYSRSGSQSGGGGYAAGPRVEEVD